MTKAKSSIVLYLIPFLFIGVVVLSVLGSLHVDIRDIASDLENALAGQEKRFYGLMENGAWVDNLFLEPQNKDRLAELSSYPATILAYQDDSLVFWSDNKVTLPRGPEKLQDGSNFMRLKNGWYDVVKFEHCESPYRETVIAAIPIKYEYDIQNEYLANEFALDRSIPSNVQIRLAGSDEGEVVRDLNGNPLFSIYSNNPKARSDPGIAILLMNLAAFLALFILIHTIAVRLTKQRSFALGFGFLVFCTVFIRSLTIIFDYPAELNGLPLFDPMLYASSPSMDSLGDLLINIVLLVWLFTFVLFHGRIKLKKPLSGARAKGVMVFAVTLVFLTALGILSLFKSLVIDSVISFEINNFLSINAYSVVGMFAFVLAFLCFLIITYLVSSFLLQLDVSVSEKTLLLIAVAIVFGLIAFAFPYPLMALITVAWTFLYCFVFFRNHRKKTLLNSYTTIIGQLILFAGLTAILLEGFYLIKEKNHRGLMANKLLQERDYITELSFQDVERRIYTDKFIKEYFTNPMQFSRSLEDRISYLYFGSFLGKYEVDIHPFGREGYPLSAREELQLDDYINRINKYGEETPNEYLHYLYETDGNYSYIAYIPIEHNGRFSGTLIIEMKPKVYRRRPNVYPELLLEKAMTGIQDKEEYRYAVYGMGKLINQEGEYPYSYFDPRWDTIHSGEEQVFIKENGFTHLYLRTDQGKAVIVSKEVESLISPISIFSYVFCIFLVVGMFLLILAYTYRTRPFRMGFLDRISMTFRNRINLSMIFIIIVSFGIIGWVTVRYFTQEYDDYHKQRLIRKEKAVLTAIEYVIDENEKLRDVPVVDGPMLADELSVDIAAQSDIHSMDINIYDMNGDLVVSSQPAIFEKGLVSTKMDAFAYTEMQRSKTIQYMQNEQIGKLNYLSIYVPVRNVNGIPIAYLNLPYFAKAKNLREEISSFMVALVNVYVFLFVCAGFLAFLVSNSITRPLTQISEKLRKVNLARKNEPISWA